MPAARRSRASRRCATPSWSAPPARAARATGTMPWPYPSALTTAISWAPAAILPQGGDVRAHGVQVDDGAAPAAPAAGRRAGGGTVAARCPGRSALIALSLSATASARLTRARAVRARPPGRSPRRRRRGSAPPAPGPAAAVAARPWTSAASAAASAGGEPGREERAEDAGEHVARAGGGEPGGRAPDAADRPPSAGDDERRRPLEQDGRPGRVGQLAGGGERGGLDVGPRDLVARRRGRRSSSRASSPACGVRTVWTPRDAPQVGVGAEQGQRTGVDDARQARAEGVADGAGPGRRRRPGRPRNRARTPGPGRRPRRPRASAWRTWSAAWSGPT